MFYSELLSSPINSYNVKRLYGVDPDNDSARAALIGIYPLTEAPEGYGVSHYEKGTASYTAVPNVVSTEEQQIIAVARTFQSTLSTLRVRFGLPATAEIPQAIDGYYPLYTSEAESDYHSTNGESHEHVFDGVTYYMPDAGVTIYHGTYVDPDVIVESDDSSSDDTSDDSSSDDSSSSGGY